MPTKVRDIELGGTLKINGQLAERVSRGFFRRTWGGKKRLRPDEVPFIIPVPGNKIDWYAVPGETDCERIGSVEDLAKLN